MSSTGQSEKQQLFRGSWRSLQGKTFLAAADFDEGDEVTLTVAWVNQKVKGHDPQTKKEVELPAIGFEETDRVLVVKSKILGEQISAATGTVKAHAWVGKKITLRKEWDPKAFGGKWAIRVKQ